MWNIYTEVHLPLANSMVPIFVKVVPMKMALIKVRGPPNLVAENNRLLDPAPF